VLPDWRCQLTRYGKWTGAGLSKWKEKLRKFMGKAVDASRKLAAESMAVKRLANWHSVLALDNGLQAVGLEGLQQFMPARRLQKLQPGVSRKFVAMDTLPQIFQDAAAGRSSRSVLLMPDGATQLECLWSGQRSVLHTNLDCGTIGWPGRGWLLHSLGARGERWLDPCHRRSNNVVDALAHAGLGVFRSEGLVLTNTNSGPWGEAGNFQRWVECTHEYLRSTDVSDELFVLLYPYMSHDLHKGKLPASFGSEGHKAFVRDQVWQSVLEGKGTIIRSNRWFALWQRLRPMFSKWSISLLANLVQCLQRGIYSNIDDCKLFATPAAQDDQSDKVRLGAGALAKSAEPLPGSRRTRPLKGGDLEGLRGVCQNGMHLATEILASWSSRAMLMGLCALIQPIEVRHSTDITKFKTQMGRYDMNTELACKQGLGYITDTCRIWGDRDLFVNMGVVANGSTECTLDEAVAHQVLLSLFGFWRHFVALEICLVQLHSSHMPGLAFTQLHRDEAKRKEGMSSMKALWEKLELAEGFAQKDAKVEELLRDLEWPCSQWCRELMVAAAECNWERLPDDMLQQVADAAKVVSSSKPIEDSFNFCRLQVEGARNGKLGPKAVWHAVATSAIPKEFDVDPVVVEEEGQASAGHDVPEALFKPKSLEENISLGGHCSMSSFLEAADYPTLSIAKHLHLSMGNLMLLDAPSPIQLGKGWQSLLAVEGAVIWSGSAGFGEELAGVVLQCTQHGLLLWKGTAESAGGYYFFKLDMESDEQWQQITIWDPSEWKLMGLLPRVASWVQGSFGISTSRPDLNGVSFQLCPETQDDLLKYSAKHGFPHMSLDNLKKLWVEIGCKVQGRKPVLLADVLKALVTFVLGSLTEDEWKEVVAKRSSLMAQHIWRSAIEDNPELAKEAVHEADHEQVEIDAGVKKRAAKRGVEEAPPRSHTGASSSSGVDVVPMEPEGLQPKRAKLVAPFNVKHYTMQAASFFLPKSKGCTISPVGNRQWQVKYRQRATAPRSHTCTYTDAEGSHLEHCRALVQCLEWAWRVHHVELGLEACPHNLQLIAQGS